jgi:hypothetical protein
VRLLLDIFERAEAIRFGGEVGGVHNPQRSVVSQFECRVESRHSLKPPENDASARGAAILETVKLLLASTYF